MKSLKLNQIGIDAAKFQFRSTEVKETQVQWLVNNWKDNVVDPLDVWEGPDGKYYLLAGHHRLEAAKRLGKQSLNCRIHKGTENDAQMIALLSNANRLEYTLFEKSDCVVFLVDKQGYCYTDVSEALTETSAYMARRLYGLKYLKGTSWEREVEALDNATVACEVGVMIDQLDDDGITVSTAEIESLFRVITTNELSGAPLKTFLKDIAAKIEEEQKKAETEPKSESETESSEEEQTTLFNMDDYGTKILKTVEKKAAKNDLALQTWWLYTMVQDAKNDVPKELQEALMPVLRKLYANAVDSELDEEEPKRSATATKPKTKAELKKEFVTGAKEAEPEIETETAPEMVAEAATEAVPEMATA